MCASSDTDAVAHAGLHPHKRGTAQGPFVDKASNTAYTVHATHDAAAFEHLLSASSSSSSHGPARYPDAPDSHSRRASRTDVVHSLHNASTCQRLVSAHRWNCWGAGGSTHARQAQTRHYMLSIGWQQRKTPTPVGPRPVCIQPPQCIDSRAFGCQRAQPVWGAG